MAAHETEATIPPRRDARVWFGYAVILTLFAINVYRAHTQSVTHDEAFSYRLWIAGDWADIWFRFVTSNHTLHSLLAKASVESFGLSHLSLRLPSLLSGAIYLIAVEAICRRLCRSSFDYALALALLAANPFVLDYVIAARGYGLALGFLMLALLLAWQALQRAGHKTDRKADLFNTAAISCLCALSVSANLSFAFANASLLAVYFCMRCIASTADRIPTKALASHLLALLVPGLLLYAILTPSFFLDFSQDELKYGAENWWQTYQSVKNGMFGADALLHGPAALHTFLSRTIDYILSALYVAIAIGLIGIASALFSNAADDDWRNDRSVLLFGLVLPGLTLSLVIHGGAHIVFDVALPRDRTALYVPPFAVLIAAACIERLRTTGNLAALRAVARISLVLIVVFFAASFRVDHFWFWKYDAGTREVFIELSTLSEQHGTSDIAAHWLLTESLNFYRTFYAKESFPVLTRAEPGSAHSLFALLAHKDAAFIAEQDLVIVYEHPVSRAVVARRP